MTRVAVLHPGEMGAAVGATLAGRDHEVVWLPAGRSNATVTRAAAARLRPAVDLAGCDVVVSLCPPAEAVAVAGAAVDAGLSGVYVDANAVAPATAERIASLVTDAGASYVDGSVIGGPPDGTGTTRLYLSGPGAEAVAALAAGSSLEAVVLDGPLYGASALKMCFATSTKIGAAVLLSARAAAEALGVGDALDAEWGRRGLDRRYGEARASAGSKGWRWTGEMDEIAGAMAGAGLDPGLGRAAASIYAAFPRPAEDDRDGPPPA